MTARQAKRSSGAVATKDLGPAIDPHEAWPNYEKGIRTSATIGVDRFRQLRWWAHRGKPHLRLREVLSASGGAENGQEVLN
jgi:hypothetical protein